MSAMLRARHLARDLLPRPVVRALRRRMAGDAHDEVALIARSVAPFLGCRLMVDVGACHGRAFEPFIEKGWRVLAFEPDPVNRAALKREWRHAIGHSLTLDARALGEEERAAATFYRSPVSQGISSLVPFHDSHDEGARVAVTTLRTVLAEQGITDVGFLKIDTEGNDLPVLRGWPWETSRPESIVCEFEDAKTASLGYTWRDMAGFLEGHGYEVLVSEWFPITRYGARHRWRSVRPWPCDLADPLGWGNLVAFLDPAHRTRFEAAARG